MMKTLISMNEASNAQQRPWWQVRGALRAALVLVTIVAIAMCLQSDLRIAVRSTLLDPALLIATSILNWEGWLPIAFAVPAGIATMFGFRRARGVPGLRFDGRAGTAS